MKRNHPDLPGGDPAFAAEINGAYALLKAEVAPGQPAVPALQAPGTGRAQARRQRGRLAGLAMVLGAGGAVLLAPSSHAPPGAASEREAASGARLSAPQPMPDTLDLQSLPDEDAIASGVGAALRYSREGRGAGAAQFSRGCEQDLRRYPSPKLLDHCVAFDAASAWLEGSAPDARFKAEEMAARHVGAAIRLSNDPVLAEERIASVRRKAQQLLLQPR